MLFVLNTMERELNRNLWKNNRINVTRKNEGGKEEEWEF